MKKILVYSIISLVTVSLFGQSEIVIPTFDDKYSEYVKQLESGGTNIDYQDFRFSFIESQQFKIASKKNKDLNNLTINMYNQMDVSDYLEIISTTKQMLSIDYTNMLAHKILRQTYEILEDTLNAQKYKDIQMGLLKSIVKNGDGKTCATGWSVIQVSEEYFILNMLGAELQKQSLIDSDGICDEMEVIDDDGVKIYYFDVSKVFEGRENLMKN